MKMEYMTVTQRSSGEPSEEPPPPSLGGHQPQATQLAVRLAIGAAVVKA